MKGHTENTKAFYAVLLAAILGGGMPVFAKIGVSVIPPLTFSFLRFLLATVFILPIIFIKKPNLKQNLVPVFIISFLASLNIILFAFGIRLTSATIAQTLGAGVPFLVLIMSYVLLNERITVKKILGIGIGFFGLLVIIISPALQKKVGFQGEFIGNLLVFAGVILFSLYSVVSKKIQKRHSPMSISFAFIVTTLLVTSLTLPLEFSAVNVWIPKFSVLILFSLIYVGSIGGIVYYYLQQKAIKHGSPLIASMLLYLQPVSAYVWAYFLLGERLTTEFIIGAILTFIGAGIITVKKN